MLFDATYQKILETKAAVEAEIAGKKAADEVKKAAAAPATSLSKTVLIVAGIGLGLYFFLKK